MHSPLGGRGGNFRSLRVNMLRFPRFFLRPHLVTGGLCLGIIASSGLLPALGAVQAAAAQPAVRVNQPEPRHANEEGVRQLLARHITRIGLMDLRAVPEATPVDYDILAILLSFAHDLVPRDEEILRRYIDAAYSAGEEQLVLDLTRRLIAADIAPNDTIAQLRLITASIARRNQTAEERLQSYEEFLGPRGRAFDPAIRSRLALDAALLLRERGDDRGFLEKLTLATQLDPTHKEAASLAATVISESGQGARATFEGLSLLLMADPVDPNVHLAIARHLATAGAYSAAERFHRNAIAILKAAGSMPEQIQIENRILAWHAHGPAVVLAQLNRELLLAQDEAARAIRSRQQQNLPAENLPLPEDIRYPLNIGAMAVLLARAAGDETAAQGHLNSMVAEAQRIVKEGQERVLRGQLDEAQEALVQVNVLVQLQTTRLWAGLQIETAAGDIADANNRRVVEQINPDILRILDGWLALRQGKPEEALRTLGPLAGDDLFSLLGIAAAYEELNETEQAREAYLQVLRRAPLEAGGAWAQGRLRALGVEQEQRQIAALERLSRTIPDWVDRLVTHPRQFVQVSARAIDAAPEGLDQNRIRLTIRNVSDVPLALGGDRAINSRMLVAPKQEFEGRPRNDNNVRPEVIDIDRRLRLMPRETLEVEVWADPGVTGWLTDVLANQTVRTRWRIVQGFVMDSAVGFRPGPMSQVAETGSVVRTPLPETSLPPELLASRVASGASIALPRLAAAVRARLLQPLIAPVSRNAEPLEAMGPAIQAFVNRYPQLSATERAALVAILPHATMLPLMAPFDEIVRADTDPLVMAIVLTTRITSAEDEYLARAAESGDERLAALARGVAQRLGRTDPRINGELQLYSRINFPGADGGGAGR
jgi:tetratricopeptide (TPR) repeat protein